MYRYLLPLLLIALLLWTWVYIDLHKETTAPPPSPPTDLEASALSAVPPTPQADAPTDPVRVPILVYHSIRDARPTDTKEVQRFVLSPDQFEEHLSYLTTHGFTTITFADLDRFLASGAPLPDKPVILSFDDGWRGQFTYALPLLTKYGAVATFFLYPNVLGHPEYLTWEEAMTLVTQGMEIGSHSQSHQYMHKQDEAALQKEIAGSRALLEERLNTAVTTFAYPFGVSTEHIRALVEGAGYRTARGLRPGTTHTPADRFDLRSYLVRDDVQDTVYFLEHTL